MAFTWSKIQASFPDHFIQLSIESFNRLYQLLKIRNVFPVNHFVRHFLIVFLVKASELWWWQNIKVTG